MKLFLFYQLTVSDNICFSADEGAKKEDQDVKYIKDEDL